MKVVLREWLKDKSSCVLCLVGIIARIINVILSTEVVLAAARVIEDIDNWQEHLFKMVLLLSGQALASIVVSMSSGVSRHNLFTTLNNLYADKVLNADYEMFTKFSCSRVVTASEQLWKITAIGGQISNMVLDVVTVIVLVINIWRVAPQMTIPVVIVYSVGLILMKILFKHYNELDTNMDEVKRIRNQEIDETINGFIEVRSFCMQEHHRTSIHDMNRRIRKTRVQRAYVNAWLNTAINLVDGIAVALILIYAVHAISSGALQPAMAMTLVTFVWRMVDPLFDLLNEMDELSVNMSQLSEYDKIVSYQNSDIADSETTALDVFESKIRFKGVTFGYDKSTNVLEGLDMVIPKGKKIGICGTSGGGKTTIMKLLMKYYVPQDGTITFDGIDYRKLTADSIREKIGIVHQENHIFSASIWDNITYGNPYCTEAAVEKACINANIYDFIQSLPDKFETKVGPRGLKLSGGQKQRIALARIFLRNPDIILLDEATSALDNESERVIQDAMNMFAGKTIIAIAHRLSTIKDSDIIYVINDHKVVGKGTHEELLRSSKEYRRLNK